MEPEYYLDLAEIEDKHWWYVARRGILRKILSHFCPDKHSDILEIGCGNGGNLELLAHYGNVYAVEMDDGARSLSDRRGIASVEKGFLPDDIPFDNKQFDIITIFDVLEHIENDLAALTAIHSRLKTDGRLILTVPAYPFLWSELDLVNHHKRRYLRTRLNKLFHQAGFIVLYSTYFNTLLLPVILAARAVNKIIGNRKFIDAKMPSEIVNSALTRIFYSERTVMPAISLPFGLSILVVAQINRTFK